MRIEICTESYKKIWDDFLKKSKNGTFLFSRDYMLYHKDRFEDYSLLVWDQKDHLIALLPANKQKNVLISHGGLTYGGVVTDEHMKTNLILKVFTNIIAHLKQIGFHELIYKPVPHIYHRLPAGEDLYALFRHGAVLYRRDITTIVIPALKSKFQERRRRSVKKAQRAGVTCLFSEDYDQFWPVLEHNLHTVYNRKPVHTLDEIRYLRSLFPENIKLFAAFMDNDLVAGVVIYESEKVAHAQYTASSEKGRQYGALDLLFLQLITENYKDKSYFDFGISTESDGKYLNQGLIDFKEGFGGRAVMYDSYKINLIK